MRYETKEIEIISKEEYDHIEPAMDAIPFVITAELNKLKDSHIKEGFHLISMQILQRDVIPTRIDRTLPVPNYKIRYRVKVRLIVTYELHGGQESISHGC